MSLSLQDPTGCALFWSTQAGLLFGVGSEDRHTRRNNSAALARTRESSEDVQALLELPREGTPHDT